MEYRKTSQFLMPAVKPQCSSGMYDIYPAFHIEDNQVFRGIHSLVTLIAQNEHVILDGFSGVFFHELRDTIDSILVNEFKLSYKWLDVSDYLKTAAVIDRMLEPFLGGGDPLFGTRTKLSLRDLYNVQQPFKDNEPGRTIIYGPGASLFQEDGLLVYFDLPKNEVQFRSRAGRAGNIGSPGNRDQKAIYKRNYFADWVLLKRHKENIIDRIDVLADAQRNDEITWMHGSVFRETLILMSHSAIRARPWFEPGTWGGSWIKTKINGVNTDVPNYAWSFELITPENGLIIESSGLMLEFSFDFLMAAASRDVLGDCADAFGKDFPIRFDFLDTFNGGNLSVQCHPRKQYAREKFGEEFTQEEAYYILDSSGDSKVYLGFRDDIDRKKFRNILEESTSKGTEVRIEDYVMLHNSKKHDLFLIPPGTVHASGRNNLVLEISSTPYIFTFKMYDWIRPDLDGKPRTLNIERAFENLNFEMKGERVPGELIPAPKLISQGKDWSLFHLKTHKDQLYDVHRCNFLTEFTSQTGGKCLVLNLVEGESIEVRTENNRSIFVSYAETFIIPAAAGKFTLVNNSSSIAIVVMAFVK